MNTAYLAEGHGRVKVIILFQLPEYHRITSFPIVTCVAFRQTIISAMYLFLMNYIALKL